MERSADTCYGQCRCCSIKGQHRDLMKEYFINGTREVYIDLILECFNIYLCINDRSSLICSSCINKLRDASDFRKMVMNTEQRLVDAVAEKQPFFVNFAEPSIDVNVKIEQQDEARSEDSCDMTIDFEKDDSIDNYDVREPIIEIDVKEETEEAKNKDHLDVTIDVEKDYTIDNYNGKKKTPKSIKNLRKLSEPTASSIRNKAYMAEKHAHIQNISTVLKYSNLTAFKTRRKSGFPCFYCLRIYENFEILREHQYTNRCKANLNKMLSKSVLERLVVYVHVTELTCNICYCNITNLNDLKSHLTNDHEKKLHPEYGDRIIPFKLTKSNEYECQSCGFNFETFGAIERHMNVHYRNFVCDQCGAGYVTKSRLKMHINCSHTQRSFPCNFCNKVFDTQHKQKYHVDSVHKMVKKNKCPKCPESFTDYFNRHQHMVDAHGEQPLQYRCKVCDKTFKRRYPLSLHMKRRHLDVKEKQCHLCPYKCHTLAELKAHMIKHNGEKTFECTVCKKSYARKKTLKEHMRIHNNDRRYVCVVCEQAFVQNCSLKGHMKTHHADYINSLERK